MLLSMGCKNPEKCSSCRTELLGYNTGSQEREPLPHPCVNTWLIQVWLGHGTVKHAQEPSPGRSSSSCCSPGCCFRHRAPLPGSQCIQLTPGREAGVTLTAQDGIQRIHIPLPTLPWCLSSSQSSHSSSSAAEEQPQWEFRPHVPPLLSREKQKAAWTQLLQNFSPKEPKAASPASREDVKFGIGLFLGSTGRHSMVLLTPQRTGGLSPGEDIQSSFPPAHA